MASLSKHSLLLDSSMSQRIAFLGAGQMGRGMISNLASSGYEVTVFNRSEGVFRLLEHLPIRRATSPAEAVGKAEVIISMVTDDAASEALWQGSNGALEGDLLSGALAIESSTVSLGRVKALAEAARQKGLELLDCPVAGRPDAARSGSLTVFVGGSESVAERATPILEAVSKAVFYMGGSGSGILFKLLYNAVGATQIASLAEAMAVCKAAGLDLHAAAGALKLGSTGSPHVVLHSELMASGNYPSPPPFTPAGRVKDLNYAIDAMRSYGIEPGTAVASREVFGSVSSEQSRSVTDSQIVDYVPRVTDH